MAENTQPTTAVDHDGFIYGLEAFVFAGKELGLISNDGLDWGGDEPSTNKIWAAQKRSAPVKEIEENPGTSVVEFDLIELKPENLVQVMGGTTSKNGKKWNAPAKRIKLEGPAEIRSADGAETTVAKVSLLAYPKGKFGYSDVMKIHCKATFLLPDDPEASPYGFDFAPDGAETPVR